MRALILLLALLLGSLPAGAVLVSEPESGETSNILAEPHPVDEDGEGDDPGDPIEPDEDDNAKDAEATEPPRRDRGA